MIRYGAELGQDIQVDTTGSHDRNEILKRIAGEARKDRMINEERFVKQYFNVFEDGFGAII